MHGKIAIPLDDRGLIGVTGGETRSFLQGLISNDIDKGGPHPRHLHQPAHAAGQVPA